MFIHELIQYVLENLLSYMAYLIFFFLLAYTDNIEIFKVEAELMHEVFHDILHWYKKYT